MIKGIGVDMVSISEMARHLECDTENSAFERRTFTEAEREAASKKHNKAEYYATRFAAKEAVTKAVAPLCPDADADLRIVETLNRSDGAPYVSINERLGAILNEVQIDTLHISITTEGDNATAFVVACGGEG